MSHSSEKMTPVVGRIQAVLDRELSAMTTSGHNSDADGEDSASQRTSLRSTRSVGRRSTMELIEEEPYVPPPQTFFFVINKEGVKKIFNLECRVGPFLKYMKKYMGMCDEELMDFCDMTDSRFKAIFRADTHSYLSELFTPLNVYIPCRVTTDAYGSADFVQPLPNDWREKYRHLDVMINVFLDIEHSRSCDITRPAFTTMASERKMKDIKKSKISDQAPAARPMT